MSLANVDSQYLKEVKSGLLMMLRHACGLNFDGVMSDPRMPQARSRLSRLRDGSSGKWSLRSLQLLQDDDDNAKSSTAPLWSTNLIGDMCDGTPNWLYAASTYCGSAAA